MEAYNDVMRADVVLTDGFQRKTLAAVRGLGNAGIRVAVGEIHPLASSLFSRHARETFTYPSPISSPDGFVRRLNDVAVRLGVGVIIPMEETTLLAILRRKHLLASSIVIPFAPADMIERASDKAAVMRAAEDLAIPVPRSYDPVNAPLPAVVKPRFGSGARGVCYCRTRSELSGAVESVTRRYGPVIVQEYIPSDEGGACVSLLFDKQSDPVASFTHRRLREYPVTGGPSTLRISARNAEIEEYARRILTTMQWYGIASVEFRRDSRDGRYRFLEINPRFWGSLNLAIKAGVNFPLLLYRLARGEPIGPTAYRIGVRSRWLFPGDCLHFLRNPRRFHLKPGFFEFRDGGVHDDFWEADDPNPVIGMLASALPLVMKRDFRRFIRV